MTLLLVCRREADTSKYQNNELLTIVEHRAEVFPDLVERIWIAETTAKEVTLIVPPNQYVNLIFPLNNTGYKRNQTWITTPQIEGVSSANTILTYPKGTRLVGIRFFAFGSYPFLKIQGEKIFNKSFELENKNKVSTYSNTDTDSDLFEKSHRFLQGLFSETSYKDVLQIKEFYNQFRWGNENCSIEEYCKATKTNYSTLNRNFIKIAGISTKKFERLIKFRKSLCNLIGTDDSLTSIALTSGYFDQAHFIREFKKFSNHTPSGYQSLIKQRDEKAEIINYNFRLF
ncbi:MAG: helix-turn-helix transcriptional regulator [Roseivirga sp.]|nr:helix-turn-helix transcriptional regulator [Roseivirga sp.]